MVRTYGRVEQTVFDNRVYYKPALRKPVIRSKGVNRVSKKVLEINKQLEALRGSPEHPARLCKGKPWKDFVKCLKAKMDEVIHPVE